MTDLDKLLTDAKAEGADVVWRRVQGSHDSWCVVRNGIVLRAGRYPGTCVRRYYEARKRADYAAGGVK